MARYRYSSVVGKCMDHKMHGLLMTLEYTAVSDMWHIWHILRMYHRVTMWSMSSEAIAEHVGSLIRYVEKNTVPGEHSMCLRSCALLACGRPVCAGTTAMPPFIMRAMWLHFRKKGGMHICLARPRPKGNSAEMRGPSHTISKIRERIIADHDGHNTCHPWRSLASRS